MDKDKFWDVIYATLEAYDGSIESYLDVLHEELEKESLEDLVKWQETLEAYLEIADKEKLWAVSYLINDALGDDNFEYFKAWLISLGEEVFTAVLEDPDHLGELLHDIEDPEDFLAEFEEVLYAAVEIYAQKSGLEPEEAEADFYEQMSGLSEVDKQLLVADINFPEDMDEGWDPEDEQALAKLFPHTYQKFVG